MGQEDEEVTFGMVAIRHRANTVANDWRERQLRMNPHAPAANEFIPRVYRTDERTRHAVNFFLFALSGLFFSLTVLYATGILHFRGRISGMLWADFAIAVIVLFLGSGYNKRAILREDSIEVAGWFYSRKLNFAEIRGRQTTGNKGIYSGFSHILVPSDPAKRKLVLPPYLHEDQFFRDWLKAIPMVPR